MAKSRSGTIAVLVAITLTVGPASIASTTTVDDPTTTPADPTTTTPADPTTTTPADPTTTTLPDPTTTTLPDRTITTLPDVLPSNSEPPVTIVAPGSKPGPTDQADPLTLAGESGDSVTTAAVAIAAAEGLPSGFVEETVLSGFTLPTMVRFASDGRVFVVEKRGMVLGFDSLSDPTPKTVINLTGSTYAWADRGMHGMALDPSFPSQPYVYLLYATDPIGYGDTCPNPPGGTIDGCVANARLSRFQINANNDVVGSEQTLLNGFWCQQYPSHSIGDLAFGADGALYLSAGDGASFIFADYGQGGGTNGSPPPTPENPCGDPPVPIGGDQQPPVAEGGALRSQDLRTSGDAVSFDGSILRIDKNTGAAFPGNPLLGGDPQDDRIVAIGQRNPFRITTRPGTSEVWTADVGWNQWEEINRLPNPTSGLTNLGWPCYEGASRNSSYDNLNLNICESFYAQGGHTGPYFTYRHGLPVDGCDGQASSTSAIVFYEGGNYPSEYDNSLFFADYTRQCMWVMFRGTNGLPNPNNILLFATATPSVGLEVGPNGDIFSVDHSAGTIVRYRFAAGGNNPPTAVASASPTSGTAPLTVNFNGSGSNDPDQDPLAYAWDLDGDGQFDDSTSVNPSFTYTTAGTRVVGLQVSDGQGGIDTDTVTINVTGGGGGGDGSVDLPGLAGNYISAPDHSRLDVTGDLDLRADVALDDWQTNDAKLISKLGGAYELMLDKTTGGLRVAWRDSGSLLKIRNSTAALPVADGARLQVRGLLDVDNGAGGHTVTFYYRTNTALSLSDNSGWTQLGSPLTFAGVTNINPDNSPLSLGSSPSGGSNFWSGNYYQALILSGSTTAANPDFRSTAQLTSTPPNYSQWRDTPGNNFTINGTAWAYNPGGGGGNNPPTVTISTPSASETFFVGEEIAFSGGATDPEDGALPASRLVWELIINHCVTPTECHEHPDQSFPGVASGTFDAPDHEYPSTLTLRLTATDSGGLNATDSEQIDPDPVTLTFQTVPTGLELTVGSRTDITPFTHTVIVGSQNSITAPSPQSLGAENYVFSAWSDGGAQSHNITAPATATTYTATYQQAGGGNNPPTAVASASPTSGTAPLTVNFNGSGSNDPDQDPLAYAWDLDGDGQFDDSTSVNPSFTYTTAGTRVVGLQVSDGQGGIDTDTVTINVTGGGGGGDGSVDLPGLAGNYISAPDHSRLDVTGDLDLRADVALDDWQTNDAKLISKLGGAYELMLDKTTGGLRVAWRDSGSLLKIRNSTAALPVADGARLQVRGLLDVDNGAGGHTVTFYYRTNTALSLSDNSGWTQLGSPLTFAGVTNINPDNSPLSLGSSPSGGSNFWSGNYYQALILSGSTTAANPDFRSTAQLTSTPPNYSQWRDTPGNNFTINGTAWAYNPGGGGGNNPPTAVASASPTSGTAPLTVNFNGSGSNDPDQDPLAYAWDLDGDGQFDDSTSVNPSFTYTTAGTRVVGLQVSDGQGGIDTDTVTINVTGGGGGGDGSVDLPGLAGNYISAPDHSRLDVTGDLDLRADVALDDWQTNDAKLISKLGGAYELMLDKTTGGLRVAWRDSGSLLKIRNSTAALPVADGARLQVRGLLDVDNGAGGHTVTFYYRTNTALSLSDNSGWTQLGSPLTFAGVTNINPDNSPLSLGSSPSGGSNFWSGNYYQALILSGSTTAANPDFRSTAQLTSTPPNYSQWRDTPGNNFTINGTAWTYNPS